EVEFVTYRLGVAGEALAGRGDEPLALLPRRDHLSGDIAITPRHQADEVLHDRFRILPPGRALEIESFAALPILLEIGPKLLEEVTSYLGATQLPQSAAGVSFEDRPHDRLCLCQPAEIPQRLARQDRLVVVPAQQTKGVKRGATEKLLIELAELVDR